MEIEGAWPASQGDSEAINAAGEREVSLEAPQRPDTKRWADAGWTIVR
jgi:hypothetical protein